MSKFPVALFLLSSLVFAPLALADSAGGAYAQPPFSYAPYIQEWNNRLSHCQVARSGGPVAVLPMSGFPQPLPTQKPAAACADYYLEEISHGALRWDHCELTVCIEEGGVGYRNSYGSIFVQALNEWTRASGGRIQFCRTNYPQAADIVVDWLAGSPAAGEAGNTQIGFRVYGGHRVLSHAHIDIAALVNGRQVSDSEMKKTCLHELGHALGLVHTSAPGDIMFYRSNPNQATTLSARDAATIRRLYGLS